MSHGATNWAILQRGLKPAAKVVLWNLADRHNKDTRRCDPSQDLLAHDCEMSRSTLNLHLKALEDAGLIRRIQRSNRRTRKQETTFYQLAYDTDFASGAADPETQDVDPDTQDDVEPCPKTGHGPVSEKPAIPCPKNRDSRVRNSDTNPVREPGKEPFAGASGREDVPKALSMATQLIKTGKPYLCQNISGHLARGCIEAGLVTIDECRMADVPV